MPAPPKPSDIQKQLVTQLLSTDTELRALARQFVVAGLREMVDQLHRGDAATRAAIARSLASTVTRAITDGGEDDADADLRAELHTMMHEMREELGVGDMSGETAVDVGGGEVVVLPLEEAVAHALPTPITPKR